MSKEDGKIGVIHPNELTTYGLYELTTHTGAYIREQAQHLGTTIETENGDHAIITVDQKTSLEASLESENIDTFVPYSVHLSPRKGQITMQIRAEGYFNGRPASATLSRYGRQNGVMQEYTGFNPQTGHNHSISFDMAHGVFMTLCVNSVVDRRLEELKATDSQNPIITNSQPLLS